MDLMKDNDPLLQPPSNTEKDTRDQRHHTHDEDRKDAPFSTHIHVDGDDLEEEQERGTLLAKSHAKVAPTYIKIALIGSAAAFVVILLIGYFVQEPNTEKCVSGGKQEGHDSQQQQQQARVDTLSTSSSDSSVALSSSSSTKSKLHLEGVAVVDQGTDFSMRCGASWAIANSNCGTLCPSGTNKECGTGEICYAYLSPAPCSTFNPFLHTSTRAGAATTTTSTTSISSTTSSKTQRCGGDWTHASMTCGLVCPNGVNSDCPQGQTCYSMLDTKPCESLVLGHAGTGAFTFRNYSGTPGPGVVVYWTNWSPYSRVQNAIDRVNLTHVSAVNYAFVSMDGFGNVFASDPKMDNVYIPLLNTKVRAKYRKLRTMASIGGWSGSQHFSKVFASPKLSQVFANNIKQFLDLNGFDGVDIDFEYPNGGGLPSNPKNTSDAANFGTFLTLLRKTLGPSRAISIAVAADPVHYVTPHDGKSHLQEYLKSVDYFQVMTYDFVGPWSGKSDFPAPLNPTTKYEAWPSSSSLPISSTRKPVSGGGSGSSSGKTTAGTTRSSSTNTKHVLIEKRSVNGTTTTSVHSTLTSSTVAESSKLGTALSKNSTSSRTTTTTATSSSTKSHLAGQTLASSNNSKPIMSMVESIKAYTNVYNISASKLIMGIPFYGRSWKVISKGDMNGLHEACDKPGQSLTNPTPCDAIVGDALDSTVNPPTGTWLYLSLRNATLQQNVQIGSVASPLSGGGPLMVIGSNSHKWTREYFAWSETATLYNNISRVLIAYEDVMSVKAKSEWAKSAGMVGGVMIWEISMDYQGELMTSIMNGWVHQ